MNSTSITCLLISTFSAAAGQLMLKIGADDRETFLEFINIWILGGLFLYMFGALIWIYVLSKENISSVYAFTTLTLVLVLLGGVVLLGEQFDRSVLAGSVVIIFGLLIITFKPV